MKVDIFLLDPPWQYFAWNETTGGSRTASRHYKTSPMEQFYDLPVLEACNPNALLLIWATYPQLMALDPLVQAWNEKAKHKKDRFKYKTVMFTFNKLNKHWKEIARSILKNGLTDAALEEVMVRCFANGNGYYTMANPEILVVYRRGASMGKKLQRATKKVRNFQALAIGEHSEKPEKIHALIDQIYPNATKLEGFARRQYPGWTCIGKVLSKRDIHLDLRDFIDDKKPQALNLF